VDPFGVLKRSFEGDPPPRSRCDSTGHRGTRAFQPVNRGYPRGTLPSAPLIHRRTRRYAHGLLARRDPPQAERLRQWLEQRVRKAFEGRMLAVDLNVALRSAESVVPNPRADRDALIAATAIVHRLTVVTRNTADFVASGVPLLNPWDQAG
jgi:predicted nucleic acid-binding protein